MRITGLYLTWLCIAAGAASADPGFIPLPLPTRSVAPPATDASDEIERAVRTVRQRLEERGLEQRGSRSELETYRVRELRTLDRNALEVPRGDAARVRADIDRASERLELERRLDAVEDRRRVRALSGD